MYIVLISLQNSNMPNVQIFLQQANAAGHLMTVDEAIVVNHLEKIRDVVVTMNPRLDTKRVYVTHGASGPLKFVLERVVAQRDQLYIKIGDRQLKIVIAMYEAMQVLGVKPVQTHFEGHIVGHITHNKLTPEDIEATQKMFGHLRNSSRCWTSLIYQLGWYFAGNLYTDDEASTIARTLEGYPALYTAVQTKQDELVAKQQANEAEKAARLQNRQQHQGKGKYNRRNGSFQQNSNGPKYDLSVSTAESTAAAGKPRGGFKLGALVTKSTAPAQVASTNSLEAAKGEEASFGILVSSAHQLTFEDPATTTAASFNVDKSKTTASELEHKIKDWTEDVADVFDHGED